MLNSHKSIILDKVKKLPEKPGVYLFLDKDRKILYIGKATSLKTRVRSYFDKNINLKRSNKIAKMMILATDIDYKITDSVLEALILENILIKKNSPPYNTKEKDDKSYSLLIITKEDFPRVLTMRVREYEKNFVDKNIKVEDVYGPFSSSTELREALKLIRKIFPFRDRCEVGDIQNKPCFNFQIGLCPGVCCGRISKDLYSKNIKCIEMIFSGKQKKMLLDFKKQMSAFSKIQDFENAIKIRNIIFSLEHINDFNMIKNDDINIWKDNIKNKKYKIEAFDVAHISGVSRVGVMITLEDGKPDKTMYRMFKLEENINDDYAGLKELLERRFVHKEWSYPDMIVIDGGENHKKIAEHIINKKLKLNIEICSVVKDKKHNPVNIISNTKIVDNNDVKKVILLANSEAHRFAIKYHKKLRDSIK